MRILASNVKFFQQLIAVSGVGGELLNVVSAVRFREKKDELTYIVATFGFSFSEGIEKSRRRMYN